ncbi:ATP-binding cassette, subfamily B, AbcA/BmrA [Carnobacterium iners]|uniref:ATP-binding cassette, subfamily B, AbcA/BmrA n=2 Tax=Carnobacterium iners TaxID=1073423 RepID=A0A1X7N1X2_9LACT|nr:ATP-binding cassette, subfamily B, AbcA/BmrA [Carnobacterium iners]SMH31274.1 ATP-binding cassette, subfamily B, AbcA/BmrA [Carnobacterium iners]
MSFKKMNKTRKTLEEEGYIVENKGETKGSIKKFLFLMNQLNWPKGRMALAFLLSLFSTGASLAIPLVTKELVDSLTTASFNWQTGFFLFAVFVLQGLLGGLSLYLLAYIGETIVADLRIKLWNKVLRLPVSYYDDNETGETMSRITQDTSRLKQLVSEHLVSFITGMISIIGAVGILLYLDWKITLLMLTSIPISLAIILPLGNIMYKIARATQTEMATLSGHLSRVLGDIRLVKAYQAESKEGEKGEKAIHSLFLFGLKEAKIQSIISPVMTLVMMSIVVVILGYGGAQVSKGLLSAGTLVAIIFLLFQIIVPFAQMTQVFTIFQKAVGATERIQEILDMASEQADGITVISEGALCFEGVYFSYESGAEVLKDISFQVQPGTITAFVGPSGGGKTTIFSLLERFYLPTAGEIRLGGTPIAALALSNWRKRIGYVSQESPLLSGTIMDNIVFGLANRPSIEEVKSAAQSANALEFIEEMSNGFETLVGERGMKLSGGQRQRIAIARALLNNPEILLLDEATSNLDSGSQTHVQEALQRLMKGRTTLIIAHRLSTVVEADQLVFLERGRITGMGTHQELLESHLLYREFAKGQGLLS